MPCIFVKSKKLGNLFFCGKELNQEDFFVCFNCGDFCNLLCDFPIDDNKTCDRNLCDDCAKQIAPNLHYCSDHFDVWKNYRDGNKIKSFLENVVPFKKIVS